MTVTAHEDNALPEDWEFQIVRAYGVLAPDEFGIWGKLDLEFLSEKAKEQLRDIKGRFRDMRGRLLPGSSQKVAPPHRDAEGVVQHRRSGDALRPAHREQIARSSVGPGAERPMIPAADVVARRGDPVQRLGGRDAEGALIKAGVPREAAKYYAGRGQVFTRDGATFTWVPSHAEATVLRRERQAKERLRSAMAHLESLESKRAWSQGDVEQAQVLRIVIDEMRQEHDAIRNQAGRLGSSEVSDEDAAMAERALEILEGALEEVPPWRTTTSDGKRRPFMAAMSRDMLVTEGSSGETVPGGYYMVVDPDPDKNDFQKDQRSGWTMPVDTDDPLTYVMTHELGHSLDTAEADDPMSTRNPDNLDLWQSAMAMGDMSKYGSSIPEEGYAEAWAGLQLNDEEVPMASLMYGLWYGWFEDQRGSSPSPPPQMESLVRQLAEKSRLYEQQRNTQNAVARRQAKQQLADWLTQWSEENAG